jgi:trigger factor
MATEELDDPLVDDAEDTEDSAIATEEAEEDQEDQPLNLEVTVERPGACERHVTVTIAREDINRYYDDAYSELMPSAEVPGFRPGRAPRKLVESRFRKEITEQVKGSLLMDSLGQISEEGAFTAISEPEFDLEAIEVPDEGPMTFEFSIEVRPEFDLPEWKGLTIRRPVHEFTEADIDQQLEQMLARYGNLVPFDGPAEAGDFLTLNITTRHQGEQLAEEEEEVVRIRPVLNFNDARLEGFDDLMKGVKADDRKKATVKLTASAPNEELRGQEVEVEFEVLDVKRLRLPELTKEFLAEMGGFESEADVRDAIRSDLQRQLEYRQQQNAREQITALLTESATWELPRAMLRRQSVRELERAVMELRRSGFSEEQIRSRENELRQNSLQATATALKEHFILERIAEEEEIDVEDGDYDAEIRLLSLQSGETPRRIRAQLEKRGLMDVLRNQIIERKVISLVQQNARFDDEPFELPKPNAVAVRMAAGGGEATSAIPDVTEARPSPESEEEAAIADNEE